MKKLITISGVLILVVLAFCSCTAFHSNLSTEQRYYYALQSFNDNVELYNSHYNAALPETQLKWKEKIDPVIKTAKTALESWRDYLESTDKELYWNQQRELFLALLFQFDILSIGD